MSIKLTYIVNVQAVIVHEGRYLMIVRSMAEEYAAGTLSFVGGKVEETSPVNDVLELSIRREIMEEVGVTVGDLHYLESTHFIGSDDMLVVNVMFLCAYAAGEVRAGSPDEVAEVLWLTAEAMRQHPALPEWTLRGLEKAEAMRLKLGW